jgi:hypothetical protein
MNKQIPLKTTTQVTIIGLLNQKTQLLKQVELLEEAFQELIQPFVPEGKVSDYVLATDEKTGVLFLEEKSVKDPVAENKVVPFPENTNK